MGPELKEMLIGAAIGQRKNTAPRSGSSRSEVCKAEVEG